MEMHLNTCRQLPHIVVISTVSILQPVGKRVIHKKTGTTQAPFLFGE